MADARAVPETLDEYPARISAVALFLELAVLALGASLMARLGAVPLALYLALWLWLWAGVLKNSCSSCFYYGRTCGLGKGRLAALLFARGDPSRFAAREVTPRDLLPDLAVALVPVLAGLALLLRGFSWPLAGLLAAILALSSAGNGYVRGTLVCPRCRQRELGCPAERLFAARGAGAGGPAPGAAGEPPGKP